MNSAHLVSASNPQEAWLRACRVLAETQGHRIHGLVLNVSEPGDIDPAFSRSLDGKLAGKASETVHAVARTIMPVSVLTAADWQEAGRRLAPKLGPRSYFRRMIDYYNDGGTVNQLAEAIAALRRTWIDPGPIIFDRPGLNAMAHMSFPCLSTVQFHKTKGRLVASVSYRSHHYHSKAYGNLLGLGRLMTLVGRETELEVGQLTVFSTMAYMDRITTIRGILAA